MWGARRRQLGEHDELRNPGKRATLFKVKDAKAVSRCSVAALMLSKRPTTLPGSAVSQILLLLLST